MYIVALLFWSLCLNQPVFFFIFIMFSPMFRGSAFTSVISCIWKWKTRRNHIQHVYSLSVEQSQGADGKRSVTKGYRCLSMRVKLHVDPGFKQTLPRRRTVQVARKSAPPTPRWRQWSFISKGKQKRGRGHRGGGTDRMETMVTVLAPCKSQQGLLFTASLEEFRRCYRQQTKTQNIHDLTKAEPSPNAENKQNPPSEGLAHVSPVGPQVDCNQNHNNILT